MAEIFKPTFQDHKTGQSKPCRYWYARVNGKRVSLGVTDKRVAQAKADQIERTMQLGYDPELQEQAKRRPIEEHVVAYEKHLKTRDRSHNHVYIALARIRKMVAGCGFRTIADLTTTTVENWLADRKKKENLSAQTRKHFARIAMAWGRWMQKAGIVSRNPFDGIKTDYNVAADRRRVRRALTPDECARLVQAAGQSQRRLGGMAGPDRRMFYLVALTTGYRKGEMGVLTVESFHLDDQPPQVVLHGLDTKNRRAAQQPIPRELADELRLWLAGKSAGVVLFPVRGKKRKAMLHADLKAAGIPVEVDGRVVDLHAMRVSYITGLIRAGTPLAMAQKLARHSTPTLTANVYTQATVSELAKYVDGLPRLARPARALDEGK